MNYFKQKEFRCKCCEGNQISQDLIDKLNVARYLAKTPFIINSGYRCKDHNKNVGGKSDSSHLKGLAVDIRAIGGVKQLTIVKALLQAGFTRIGVAKEFIHCDIDNDKKDTLYTY